MIRDAPKMPPPFCDIRNTPLKPVIANKSQPSVDKVAMIDGLVLSVEEDECA